MKFFFLTAWLFLIVSATFCQISPVDIFENHADIGDPKNSGNTAYDPNSQVYNLKGSGYNIWLNRDEFKYAYKKISGDFILTANFDFTGEKRNGHRKIAWMIREYQPVTVIN